MSVTQFLLVNDIQRSCKTQIQLSARDVVVRIWFPAFPSVYHGHVVNGVQVPCRNIEYENGKTTI